MMCPVLQHTYFQIQYQIENVSKLTVVVSIARNVINYSIATADIASQLPNFKQLLNPIKPYLKKAKDISTIFVFTVTLAEVLSPPFWDSKTSPAKRGKRLCKLIYSGVDSFLIIPSKWKQLNSPFKAVLCKEIFLIASACFGVWHASSEIQIAQQKIAKNQKKLTQNVFKPLRDKPQLRQEITVLKNKIEVLNADIHHLFVTKPSHVKEIYNLSILIETYKSELYKKEQKTKLTNTDECRVGKACVKITFYQRQLTKFCLIKGFEITKICIVVFQILLSSFQGTVIAPVLGAGIVISSVAIGSIGLALTVHAIFYKKP